jgi:hypothetical protein
MHGPALVKLTSLFSSIFTMLFYFAVTFKFLMKRDYHYGISMNGSNVNITFAPRWNITLIDKYHETIDIVDI